jgi:hypothetical protein
MRKELYADQKHTRYNKEVTEATSDGVVGLPNRLMTAFEVAEYIGCHEETARVLARTAHVAAIRRARSPLSSRRRARLDQARRADPRVVDQPQRSQPCKEDR